MWCTIRCAPGRLLNVVGLRERTGWAVEGWNVRGTTEEVLDDFRGWHADLLALFRNIDEPYKWALALRPTMERWSKGRCTLLGDACHSMLPFLAQGAVMAIEDGFVLARCLEKYAGDHATAFARYEAVRRDRANKAVTGSAGMIARFHNPASKEGDAWAVCKPRALPSVYRQLPLLGGPVLPVGSRRWTV